MLMGIYLGIYLISYINIIIFIIQYKGAMYKTWNDFFSITKTCFSAILLCVLFLVFTPYLIVGLTYIIMAKDIIELKKRGG